MNCEAVCRWLDPLLDGELDSKNTVEVQEHLGHCAACQRAYEAKRAVSVNLRRLDVGYTVPAALRARIYEALEAEEAGLQAVPGHAASAPGHSPPRLKPAQSSSAPRWFLWAGWPVALAASALLATALLHQRDQEADMVVAAHVRSMLASHLSDVVSSSHHTVKPWFAGKIDFSPPVPDLSALGFELMGGRLDYLEYQPVAAIVYRKHGHVINVLVSRSGGGIGTLPQTSRAGGYSLRSWKQGGLDVAAVSDIDPLELANLQQGYATPPPLTPEPSNTP
jgi:anti-sigma factor RsiW